MPSSNWSDATHRMWLKGPSPHLSWAELACKDAIRTPYPLDWRETRVVDLATLFEQIRYGCGDQPITVLSAYRTRAHNAKVGGAPKSQHLQGRALDLRTPKGWTAQMFYQRILDLQLPMLRGLGVYVWGCHVDIRPTETLVSWDLRQPTSPPFAPVPPKETPV